MFNINHKLDKIHTSDNPLNNAGRSKVTYTLIFPEPMKTGPTLEGGGGVVVNNPFERITKPKYNKVF